MRNKQQYSKSRGLNTPFSSIDRSYSWKINKEILDLTYMLDQKDLTDIYSTFYPSSRIHILLKYTWNILWDRSYIRPQNLLINFKRLKAYQAPFPTMVVWTKKLIIRRKLEFHKYVGIKQHASEQTIDQRKTQNRN